MNTTTDTGPLFDPARLPQPCDMGFFMHPDVPDCDEDQDITPLLAALGYEAGFRSMESDAADLAELRVFHEDETAPARWTPTPPAGEGWLLAGKYDTEDGAFALFVRPMAAAEVAA